MAENSSETINSNDNEVKETQLTPPAPLDDASFAQMLVSDILQNNPEYVAEVMARYDLNPAIDNHEICQKIYEEQVTAVAEHCIKSAVNEDLNEAYNLLQNICYFSEAEVAYMQATEGEKYAENVISHVDERLKNVRAIAPVADFVRDVNEALLYLNNDYTNFSSYKINQIQEKFENTPLQLTNEEKGKLNFIASRLYRKLYSQEAVYADNETQLMEQQCLEKVLALSHDYKLISYCQNRMNQNSYHSHDKDVIRAYKNALRVKQSRGDSYRINMQLADLYLKQARKIGYMIPGSEKMAAADKAIQYLVNSYRFADKEDKLPVLKKMAQAQFASGRHDDWKNTKELIAMKFLKGEERCLALNAIADRVNDPSFYQKSLRECKKARMPADIKNRLLLDTYDKILKNEPNAELRQTAKDEVEILKTQQIARMLGSKLRD